MPTPSTSARSKALFDGKLYDGVTAHPHDVRMSIRDGRIELVQDGGWSDTVEGALLKRIEADVARDAK